MGTIRPSESVLWLATAFSRRPEALAWTREKLAAELGPAVLESPAFEFAETEYYERDMGTGLLKQFWAFEPAPPPERLAALKHRTNALEIEYAAAFPGPEVRPLNIDPGYLTLGKLVLASTKDHAHRLAIGQGIYAECTLRFGGGRWEPWPWTYPDYRRADFQAFFTECRRLFRERLRPSPERGGGS